MSGRLEPPVTETTAPFWDATREQRLLVQWCTACDRAIFYPREVCPACLGSSLEWRASPGRGTVYAVTVEHRPPEGMVPYAVALIELEEGIRMLSNVVGTDPDTVRVGMPVTIAWEELTDGRHLPLFEPLKGE